MAMQFHYGPTGKPTTSYGSPLRGMAFDAMRTRPLGENYFDTMRTRPMPMRGFGDVTSAVTTGASSAVKKALEFGAGYVLGSAMAPAAKDKVIYGVGAGLTSMMFGVVGLGVGALALSQIKK